MTMIVQDGPSKGRRSNIRVCQETLRINFINVRSRGYDSVDGYAGRTVEGTTMRQSGPSRDTLSKLGKVGLTDPNDGPSRDQRVLVLTFKEKIFTGKI